MTYRDLLLANPVPEHSNTTTTRRMAYMGVASLPTLNDPAKMGFLPVQAKYARRRAEFVMSQASSSPFYPQPSPNGEELTIREHELVFGFCEPPSKERPRSNIEVLSSLNGYNGISEARGLGAAFDRLVQFLPKEDAERVIADATLAQLRILGVSTAEVTFGERANNRTTTIQTHGMAKINNKSHTIYQGQMLRAYVQTRTEFGSMSNLKHGDLYNKFILVIEGVNPQSFSSMIRSHFKAYRGNFRLYAQLFSDGAWAGTGGFIEFFEKLGRFVGYTAARAIKFFAKKGLITFNDLTQNGIYDREMIDTARDGGSLDVARLFSKVQDTNAFVDAAADVGVAAQTCADFEPLLHCILGVIGISGPADTTEGRWIQEYLVEDPRRESMFKDFREELLNHVLFNSADPNRPEFEIGSDGTGISAYYSQNNTVRNGLWQPDLSKLGGLALRYQHQSLSSLTLSFAQAMKMYDDSIIGVATRGSNHGESVEVMLRK